jgi:hypothetical protein
MAPARPDRREFQIDTCGLTTSAAQSASVCPSNSGSLAMLRAMRRASSAVPYSIASLTVPRRCNASKIATPSEPQTQASPSSVNDVARDAHRGPYRSPTSKGRAAASSLTPVATGAPRGVAQCLAIAAAYMDARAFRLCLLPEVVQVRW